MSEVGVVLAKELESSSNDYYNSLIRISMENVHKLEESMVGRNGELFLAVSTYEINPIFIGGCFGGRIGTEVDQVLRMGYLIDDRLGLGESRDGPELVIPTRNYIAKGNRFPFMNREWESFQEALTIPFYETLYFDKPLIGGSAFEKGKNLTVLVGEEEVERFFMMGPRFRTMLLERGRLHNLIRDKPSPVFKKQEIACKSYVEARELLASNQ